MSAASDAGCASRIQADGPERAHRLTKDKRQRRAHRAGVHDDQCPLSSRLGICAGKAASDALQSLASALHRAATAGRNVVAGRETFAIQSVRLDFRVPPPIPSAEVQFGPIGSEDDAGARTRGEHRLKPSLTQQLRGVDEEPFAVCLSICKRPAGVSG